MQKKIIAISLCLLFIIAALCLTGCESGASATATLKTGESCSQTCLGDLIILMYHNTLAKGKKQSVYCINQDALRKDFQYFHVFVFIDFLNILPTEIYKISAALAAVFIVIGIVSYYGKQTAVTE
mgnify:CR=1 FL=1